MRVRACVRVCMCTCTYIVYVHTLYYLWVILGLQELNLSHNLLSTWDEVAAITGGLHRLHSLNISENRLAPPSNPTAELSSAFNTIRTLFANKMNFENNKVEMMVTSNAVMIIL